jgi:hypothetical protein
MASAAGRYLPHLVGIVILALLGLGCLERAKGTERSEPALSKQAIVALVSQSLTASGMPEPPLRKEATRAERKEYLAATQGALDELKKLGTAKTENRPRSAQLLLDDRTEQILAISRLIAVELADAIDRSDANRAVAAIRLASDYASFVSQRSVPDWLASAGISDTLAIAAKSVSSQLDSEMAGLLATELGKLESADADPDDVLLADATRMDEWLKAVETIDDEVSVESIEKMAGGRPDSRAASADALAEAVAVVARSGHVPPNIFIAESRIAVESVATYLREPRGPQPQADSTRHPIAAYLISFLRPTFSDAPRLRELHAENWRLLALTIKVAAADHPEDLSAMGELAISPVSKLPFEYVRRESDFDLTRPRARVDSTS